MIKNPDKPHYGYYSLYMLAGGRVMIPKEALEEYNLKASDKVILMPGGARAEITFIDHIGREP